MSPPRIQPRRFARFSRALPWLLFPLYALALAGLLRWTGPVAQPASFHDFADTRALFGLPNFADVCSNLAIFLPALAGSIFCLRPVAQRAFHSPLERSLALLFFLSLIATALGSTSYHLAPDDSRLLLDRLPIGLAFTLLLAWLCAERIPLSPGSALALLPWIALGPASVLWWHTGALDGAGDLRPYLLLYAFVFVLTPVLLLHASPYTPQAAYWQAYLAFTLGMVCDRLDHPLHAWLGGLISGHTLKHLLMGLALFFLIRLLQQRRIQR